MQKRSIFAVLCFLLVAVSVKAETQESVYERVLKTGQIRCGYDLWPATVEQDPNTGKLSGAFHDYMEALGEAMQLKIVWAEKVSYGDLVEALKANRIDAHCAGAWTNAVRGKFVEFSTPLVYQANYAYVRADDNRFDNNLQAINSPDVTVTVIDGESSFVIASTDFPQAKTLAMPKGSENTQALLNVIHKKADVMFVDPTLAGQVMKHNPGKLRKVPAKFPVKIYGQTIAVRKGEVAFKNALDAATNQLMWTGVIDRILDKYEQTPGDFLRATVPFANQPAQ